jgi:pyruvate,orthophosphate dikinase
VILARPTTSPVDLHGMIAAKGIITACGGATSHAAVVARALATPCIVGCAALEIDEQARTLTIADRTLSEGDDVSIDGGSGELIAGAVTLTRVGASGEDLALLMERCDHASLCTVLARVTTPEHATVALQRGATGVVTGIDDVLATTGHVADVIETVVRRGSSGGAVRDMQDAIADAFTPLLSALDDMDIDIRTIDVRADECRELLPKALLDEAPQLSLPVGDPDLLRAQMAGLAEAAERAGYRSTPRLVVRHVTDAREARAIRSLCKAVADSHRIAVGIYITSPRALMRAAELAEQSEVMWVEVRALQAAMFGLPASQFLTADPLDGYLRRGMLSIDPRRELDPATLELLRPVAEVRHSHPGCRIGMRLSGDVSEDIAARLYGLGFRVFAVAPDELRVARLALGKAAWA